MSARDKAGQVDELYSGFERQFPNVPAITAEQLHDLIAARSDVVLVDVRTDDEQLVSVLPGNTLSKVEFEAQKSKFRNATVVCYCTVGYRSGLYAQELLTEGFKVQNLRGSILSWTHAGYPLVEGSNRDKQTHRVHVYSKQWALQAPEYEAVTFSSASALLRGIGFLTKTALSKLFWWRSNVHEV